MGKGALSELIPGPAAQRRDNLALLPTVQARVLSRWLGRQGGVPERYREAETWLLSQVGRPWHELHREATVLLRAQREHRVGNLEECSRRIVQALELYRVEAPHGWDVVLLALERVRAAVEAQLREEQKEER